MAHIVIHRELLFLPDRLAAILNRCHITSRHRWCWCLPANERFPPRG